MVHEKLMVKGSLHISGSLIILGFIRCENDAKFSDSTKIQEDITINGFFKASGRVEGEFVKARQGIEISRTTETFNDLESDEYIKASGKLNVEGDLITKKVIFKDYMRWTFNPRGYDREIRGIIQAKELVDINRTLVGGDVREKT